jgi:hypothetical protein
MKGKAEVSRIAAIETVVFLHRKRFTLLGDLCVPEDMMTLSLDSSMTFDATGAIYLWHGWRCRSRICRRRRDEIRPGQPGESLREQS